MTVGQSSRKVCYLCISKSLSFVNSLLLLLWWISPCGFLQRKFLFGNVLSMNFGVGTCLTSERSGSPVHFSAFVTQRDSPPRVQRDSQTHSQPFTRMRPPKKISTVLRFLCPATASKLAFLYPAIKAGDFQGKAKQSRVEYVDGKRHVLIGIGAASSAAKATTTLYDLRVACQLAGSTLEKLKVRRAVVHLPSNRVLLKAMDVAQRGSLATIADDDSNTTTLGATVHPPTLQDSSNTNDLFLGAAVPSSQRAGVPSVQTREALRFFLEALQSATYRYSLKTRQKKKKSGDATSKDDKKIDWKCDFEVLHAPNKSYLADARIISDSVNGARTMGNLRPDVGTPHYYATEAARLAKEFPGAIRVTDWLSDKAALQPLGLLNAVGQGAVNGAQLIVLEYVGHPASPNTTAVVGKGVVMDTGGLNVKPYGSMETMHMDMMGAAAAVQTIRAVAALKLRVNLVCVGGFVENAVDANSYRPSTILTSLKGTTVEITNTDAEGRLVLADAFTFVQKHATITKSVTRMIDLATLTGAITVALGEHRAGLFYNDARLARSLMAAGERTCEWLWPMPIGAEHHDQMKGLLSDLTNCAPGRMGGACNAAAFLQHFVEDGVRWCHIDLAGPGMGGKATDVNPAGAPGFGVRLLVDFFRRKGRHHLC